MKFPYYSLLLLSLNFHSINSDETATDRRRLVVEGSYIATGRGNCEEFNKRVQSIQSSLLGTLQFLQTEGPRRYEFKAAKTCVIGFEGDAKVKDAVSNLPGVISVSNNEIVHAAEVGEPRSWGLDRIDQKDLPLNNEDIEPEYTGLGVSIYVLDSGIFKEHDEFEDRASYGFDFIKEINPSDNNGHGTHCAGTAGGKTSGVARNASLISVKVLNSEGLGTWESVISGINWAVEDANGKTGVLSISISGLQNQDTDLAAKAASQAGMVVVVAAGNDKHDACLNSPARAGGNAASGAGVITVGGTEIDDKVYEDSNTGSCVDIWAPGKDIVSASHQVYNEFVVKSGTSMAAPHVAGAMALLLEKHNFDRMLAQKDLFDLAALNKIENLFSSQNVLVQIPSTKPLAPTPSPTPKPTRSPLPPAVCDYVSDDNICYTYHNESVTKVEAKDACEQFGGTLVEIQNAKAEQNVVKLFENVDCSSPSGFWIGLTDPNQDGQYVWSESGLKANWTSWARGEPDSRFETSVRSYCPYNSKTLWFDVQEAFMGAYVCQRNVDFRTQAPTVPTVSPTTSRECDRNYKGICYKFYDIPLQFDDAKQFCEDRDSTLVETRNSTIRDQMKALWYIAGGRRLGFCKEIWIGLGDENHEGSFKWLSDGTLNTYDHFRVNQPDGSYKENCVKQLCNLESKPTDYGWEDVSCQGNRLPFICQSGQALPTPKPTPSPRPCDYVSDDRICYTYYSNAATHFDAESTCQSFDGNLVQIQDAKAEENVAKLFQNVECPSAGFWIGLTDPYKIGNFVWGETGLQVNFTRWAPGQPGTTPLENVVRSMCPSSNGVTSWHADIETNLNSFVCQRKVNIPPTGAPTISPTKEPTAKIQTISPTKNPTISPTSSPTKSPTNNTDVDTTKNPTKTPTNSPTASPIDVNVTKSPSKSPTTSPSTNNTSSPTTTVAIEEESNIVLIGSVTAAVVVIVLGAGLFLLSKNKKNKEDNEPLSPAKVTDLML